jgi:hypothetical protein
MSKDIVKEGKVLSFRDLKYWAQDGMVYIIDERSGEMKIEAPMVMRYRAIALAREADSMRQRQGHYRDEIKELLLAAKGLMEVILAAEEQGTPTDPEVLRQQVEERRKVYVSLSGLNIPQR